MRTHTASFTAFIILLTRTTTTAVLAAPVAAAGPLIEYHTLPTVPAADHYSHDDSISANLRSLVFGAVDKRAASAVSDAETDWENWHTQWKRQQQERRCNLWDVCVRVYQ